MSRISPAAASFRRKMAALASGQKAERGAPAMPEDGPVASEYQMLLSALGIDLNALRNIESTDRKIEAKREMIGKYLPWVDGAIEGNSGTQDEIIATMLIWSIDLADWDRAFAIASYMLANGIALPERFNRKPATLIAEEVAEAGLLKEPLIDLANLQKFSDLVEGSDIHDQVRAKLEKALGLAFKAQADAFDPAGAESAVAGGKAALTATALGHFQEALRLDDSCGVKKVIEKLTGELKKLAESKD